MPIEGYNKNAQRCEAMWIETGHPTFSTLMDEGAGELTNMVITSEGQETEAIQSAKRRPWPGPG